MFASLINIFCHRFSESLELSLNELHGPLSGRFQTMTSLQDLLLDGNDFEATLDEILDCGNCTQTLRLFRSINNPLTGTISERLLQFTGLEELHISGSNLGGTVPSFLGLLTNLVDLDLSLNGLFDSNTRLPTELGLLTKLERLFVASSLVTGQVPEEFGNLASLVELGIQETFLTGTIPDILCSVPSLQVIYYSDGITCTCPGDICSLPL
jgi:hypothetical protein